MKSLKRVKKVEEQNNIAENPNLAANNQNYNMIQQSVQLVKMNEQNNLAQNEDRNIPSVNLNNNNQDLANQQEIKPDVQPQQENNQINNKANPQLNEQPPVNELKPTPLPLENKIQKEFKNIFTNDMFSINSYRKRLLHFTFACIVVDILTLQILCLFLNICYGEYIEMIRWVSNSIAPLCVFLLVSYIILYFSSDLLFKPLIKISTFIILVILLLLCGMGIYIMLAASSKTLSEINASWDILSKQSQIYYYDNDRSLFLLNSVMSAISLVFAYQYYQKLTNDWRPELRSRLSDSRAIRYIDLYSKFNTGYKKLYEMENFQQKSENKILEENIVNEQKLQEENLPIENLDGQNKPNTVAINNENENQPKKKKLDLKRRKDKSEVPQEADENTKILNN